MRRFLAAALVLFAGAPAFAESHRSKVDRSLQDSLRAGRPTQRVIVTVDDPSMRNAIRKSLQSHGDLITAEHPLVGAFTVELHSEDVQVLANHPGVRAVSADARVSAGGAANNGNGNGKGNQNKNKTSPAPILTLQTSASTLRETLGLPRVASSTTLTGSTGIGIAIIDSGITPSANFLGNITGFYDFTRGGIPVAPFDDYGHGTHIAGLIGSSGILSNYDYQGIAPDVHLIGLKVLDKNGQGNTSDVIKALEYVTANKAHLNVQIINLSLGHPIFAPAKDDPLVQAVEAATRAGLIVVTAAGNYGQSVKTGLPGYAGIMSPANAPSAITVGAAMTQSTVARGDDRVAPYSSRGPSWYDGYAKPDVLAPGHRLASDTSIGSALYLQLVGSRSKSKNGQPLLELSGTSMSAGVTSGVIALILDAHNRSGFHRQKPLTANLVKAILEFSAVPVAGADVLTQGAGEINAGGAITLASSIDTGESAGGWWIRSGLPTLTTIGTQQVQWSQAIIWGESILTGNLLYYNLASWSVEVEWGDNIVWGDVAQLAWDNIVWGDNIIWADNIVWGDRLIGMTDGDNIVWGDSEDEDNIVWGNLSEDNIIWGNLFDDNIVWGNSKDDDNIVWGNSILGAVQSAGGYL